MTHDELLKRLVFIKGTPKARIAEISYNTRRENNSVTSEEDDDANFHDDFFEYEKELAEMKPAREIVIADLDRFSDSVEESYIIMEPMISESSWQTTESIKTSIPEIETDKSFEFIQCEFVKETGERCKKQSKKNEKYCNIHRKYLKSHQ